MVNYAEIVENYRPFFRKFLQVAFPAPTEDWTLRAIKLSCGSHDHVDGSLVVLDVCDWLPNEVLASNTVGPLDGHPDKFMATIHLNKLIYDEYAYELSERKCVMGHEWLEVMVAICNGKRIRGKGVKGKADIWALSAISENGLPMEDDEDEWLELKRGLRELLVSSPSLVIKLKELFGYDDIAVFQDAFFQSAKRGEKELFLFKHAVPIAQKLHVERSIVMSRLRSILRPS